MTHPLNADGSEATMYSGTVDETGTAKTYVPPQPKSTVVWGPQGTNKNCTSDYCRSVDVRLSNLEPGKEYKLSLYTYAGPDNAGGEWFTNPPYEVVTADENGNFSTVADGWNLMYGFPDNDFNVQVDGKVTSEHSYEPL